VADEVEHCLVDLIGLGPDHRVRAARDDGAEEDMKIGGQRAEVISGAGPT
jgi:hypothetical protein